VRGEFLLIEAEKFEIPENGWLVLLFQGRATGTDRWGAFRIGTVLRNEYPEAGGIGAMPTQALGFHGILLAKRGAGAKIEV
jgi:hypothetical protein